MRGRALESIPLPTAAASAWLDAGDTRRAAALTRPTHRMRWARWRDSSRELDVTIVRDFAQELRMYGEDELLDAWARNGDGASLTEAERIGNALAAAGGDALLADATRILRQAKNAHALAEAHLLYARGRRSYSRQQMTRAIKELHAAETLFSAEQSPFAFRAAMYEATAAYYAARYDDALRKLESIPLIERYPVLFGQVQWVIGLITFSRGLTNEALAAYKRSFAAFERAGETESRAGVEALLAQTYRVVGQDEISAEYQRRALTSLAIIGSSRRSHAILTDAARAAALQGAPLTALIFQERVVTLARLSKDPVSIADALIGYAVYAAAAGERAQATTTLGEARRAVAAVSDSAMRDRSVANLMAAEATVLRTFDPASAATAAETAIAHMQRLGHRIRLVQLHLEAGRALDRIARPIDALRHWEEGITECERQRDDLTDDEYRRTYFETCHSLFEEAIGALITRREWVRALRLAERGRARSLLDMVMRRSQAASPRMIAPRGVSIVEYSVLPHRLVTWVVNSNRVFVVSRAIDRDALRREIGSLAAARANDPTSAKRVHELLLEPVREQLAHRVIFIPDDHIYRAPFAALQDANGHFLVEQHEISIAPSLTLLDAIPPAIRGAPLAVLIGATSGTARHPSLAAAAREIRSLLSIYPEAVVVEGKNVTRANAVEAMGRGSLIHFAGHAIEAAETVDPALVLYNELLYPRDIAGLTLKQTRLVVLGACGTSDGRIGSEGPLSIGRSFLAAGARQVLATLWAIEDNRSSRLLVNFHRMLARYPRAAAALREVQIQAIRSGATVSDWSAFEILQTTSDEEAYE